MSDIEKRALQAVSQLPKLSEIEDDWQYCLKCRQGEEQVVSSECATCDNFNIQIIMDEIIKDDNEVALEIERQREYEEYLKNPMFGFANDDCF